LNSVERITRANGYRVLALRGGWSREADAEIARGDFDELSIHMGDWPDFEFLIKHARTIERLSITSAVKSFRGIEELVDLKELSLLDAPSPPIDLTRFVSLERCELKWHKGYSSRFFLLPHLRDLTISHYTERDCKGIAEASALEKLDLRQSRLETLSGIEGLKSLTKLSLAHLRHMHDASAIGALRGLESIHVEKCPLLTDVSFAERLPNLRELFLDCGGPGFTDLSWMSKLSNLTDVLVAVPVKNIDWSILLSRPRLQRVVINTHPGYVLRDEDLYSLARSHGRTISNYVRAGTRKHPGFKFWMQPVTTQ
jgi:hypothetical protein